MGTTASAETLGPGTRHSSCAVTLGLSREPLPLWGREGLHVLERPQWAARGSRPFHLPSTGSGPGPAGCFPEFLWGLLSFLHQALLAPLFEGRDLGGAELTLACSTVGGGLATASMFTPCDSCHLGAQDAVRRRMGDCGLQLVGVFRMTTCIWMPSRSVCLSVRGLVWVTVAGPVVWQV